MQFLGVIDAFIGINFIVMGFGLYLKSLILVFNLYLIGKGVLFLGDFASIIDFVLGIILIIGYFIHLPLFILSICSFLLLQKAFFSFLG